MKLIQKTIFFTLFFSLYLPTIAHAAAEKPSAKSPLFRGGVPLTQDKLNEFFHDGARDNNPKKLSKAFNAGAQVNYRGLCQKTALHYVLEKTNYKKNDEKKLNTQQLIQYKADINAQDSSGQTPLMLSVAYQNNDITEMLLEANANTEIADNNGWTALIAMAMGFGRLDQCHLLLEWGAQPITARTEEIYSEHIAKHEQNPSAGVVQYKKDLPKALSPFIPVTTLANLVIEYVPNLEIQVMLNQARPPAADVH